MYEDIDKKLTSAFNGLNRYYSLQDFSGWKVIDPSNGRSIKSNDFTFSNNGDWMLIHIPNDQYARVNLQTHQVFKFSVASGKEMAISNDGRYAVIGGLHDLLLVYDLSTCQPAANNSYEARIQMCQSNNLFAMAKNQDSKLLGASVLRFSQTGESLTFNAGHSEAPYSPKVAMTMPGAPEHYLDYLALGDSYSAGEGDGDGKKYYLPGTDGSDTYPDEKCHNSTRAYPYLLAQEFSIGNGLMRSVACSGAQTNDVANVLNDSYKGNFKLLDKLSEEEIGRVKEQAVENNILGREAQIAFVSKYKPRNLTIGIGGNDIGFSNKLINCIISRPLTCDEAIDDRAATGDEIRNLYTTLTDTYKKLHNASPNTTIYAIGYPRIFSPQNKCGINVQLNEAEREYGEQIVLYLNQVIKAAAQNEGVIYIDIEDSVYSKALCSSESEPVVNGITWGNDERVLGLKIIGKESYHPNEKGHALIAEYIKNQVHNLGQNYPGGQVAKVATAVPTVPAYFGSYNGPTSKLKRLVDWGAQIAVQQLIILKTTTIGVRIDNLAPGSTAEVQIHSEPTSLGQFAVDAYGTMQAGITLPQDIPAGYHTLHVLGQLADGTKYDFYEPILVLGGQNDADEDGVPNDQDYCTFVTPVGTDEDGDGIDDLCDEVIVASAPTHVVDGVVTSGKYNYGSKETVNKENVSMNNSLVDQAPNELQQESNSQPNSNVFAPSSDNSQKPDYFQNYYLLNRHRTFWVLCITSFAIVSGILLIVLRKVVYGKSKIKK